MRGWVGKGGAGDGRVQHVVLEVRNGRIPVKVKCWIMAKQ